MGLALAVRCAERAVEASVSVWGRATLLVLSSRILPSSERQGSVPCSKKMMFSFCRPKYLCSAKKASVSRRVGPEVMMYHGITTAALLPFAEPEAELCACCAARCCSLRIRSAWIWKRLLWEGRPMS